MPPASIQETVFLHEFCTPPLTLRSRKQQGINTRTPASVAGVVSDRSLPESSRWLSHRLVVAVERAPFIGALLWILAPVNERIYAPTRTHSPRDGGTLLFILAATLRGGRRLAEIAAYADVEGMPGWLAFKCSEFDDIRDATYLVVAGRCKQKTLGSPGFHEIDKQLSDRVQAGHKSKTSRKFGTSDTGTHQ